MKRSAANGSQHLRHCISSPPPQITILKTFVNPAKLVLGVKFLFETLSVDNFQPRVLCYFAVVAFV